jgi:hypothetical protein
MNEYLASAIIYVIFLLFSYVFYIGSIRLKTPIFFVVGLIYFFGIYSYFELLNHLHHYLRDHKIYIEFGHADLLLIMLMLFCYLNGFIVLMVILNKRWKIKNA